MEIKTINLVVVVIEAGTEEVTEEGGLVAIMI